MDSWSISIDNLCKGHLSATHLSHSVHGVGDKDLVTLEWTAFFCSVRCPGDLVLKSYDLAYRLCAEGVPVISGFHSPVEQEVLRVLLSSDVPVCMVPARKLPSRFSSEIKRAISDGRFLVISPFDDTVSRASRGSAVTRNRFVADVAKEILVGYSGQDSKTSALVENFLQENKPVYTFDHPEHRMLFPLGAELISARFPTKY